MQDPPTNSAPKSKPEWETTIEQLRATNEELQRRKTDAEKDRELFRELYGKASSHVGEVAKENNELQERVTLAESQLREGLVMVRGTYEERLRKLEEEITKWKGMYRVLAARDRKTEGDEIRRKAALEVELSEENEQLKEDLDVLRTDYAKMEKVLEQLGEQELEQLPEEEEELKHIVERQAGPSGTRGPPAMIGVAIAVP